MQVTLNVLQCLNSSYSVLGMSTQFSICLFHPSLSRFLSLSLTIGLNYRQPAKSHLDFRLLQLVQQEQQSFLRFLSLLTPLAG